ncbi:MAG TPA: VOC family protein [Acidimicrobiales bacterium]
MDPVLHLSIVVADLDEARTFYVDTLGCTPGRVQDDWADVWFWGLQLTLQQRPDQVLPFDGQGRRHFGVTLDAEGFAALVSRLEVSPDVTWVVPVSTDHAGTPRQQTKGKLADPSGNVIEFKTYLDPGAAFAP